MIYSKLLKFLVRATGLEPARRGTYDPKSYASAIPPRPHILLHRLLREAQRGTHLNFTINKTLRILHFGAPRWT